MRLYRRLRDHVRPRESVAVPAETGGSEPAVWEPADEETAMQEVLNTTDPEEFERSGREPVSKPVLGSSARERRHFSGVARRVVRRPLAP